MEANQPSSSCPTEPDPSDVRDKTRWFHQYGGQAASEADREREVLTLIAQGYSDLEIAQRLIVSEKTIRNHVSNIFSSCR
jgi:DNA-binding NarL/FixJ family response regulator